MIGETRTFIDTNILVYAYDIDAEEKHVIARTLLTRLWENREGALSTQVLQEFYVTVTRKLPTPLDPARARRVVATYQVWPVEITVPSSASTRRPIRTWSNPRNWSGANAFLRTSRRN